MAKIIQITDEFITIELKNGKQKDYSRETIDFEPQLNDTVDFKKDNNGNIEIYKVTDSNAFKSDSEIDNNLKDEINNDGIEQQKKDTSVNESEVNEEAAPLPQPEVIYPSSETNNQNSQLSTNSTLGIVAFIMSFFIAVLGIILAIVDLVKNKKKQTWIYYCRISTWHTILYTTGRCLCSNC